MISQYNAVMPYAIPNLFLAITNRLRLHGFIVRDHYDMLNEFHFRLLNGLMKEKLSGRKLLLKD